MDQFQPFFHYLEIGELYLKVGEYEKSLESFMKITECPELASLGWINLAKVEFLFNHLRQLRRYYLKAVDLDPNSYEILYNYANFLIDIKEYEEAIEYYKKALLIEPHLALCTLQYGACL